MIYLYFDVHSFRKGRDRNLLSDSEADTSVLASLNGDRTVIELVSPGLGTETFLFIQMSHLSR